MEINKRDGRGESDRKALPMCFAAALGLLGAVGGLAGCAHRPNNEIARGRTCPVALRDAHVTMQSGADDVRVRVTAPAGGDPQAIASRAEYIAEALSTHPETHVGAGDTVRPAPGREVRIQSLPDGIELAFSAEGIVGMEVLRRRLSDRVSRWQNGDCPTVEGVNASALTDATFDNTSTR